MKGVLTFTEAASEAHSFHLHSWRISDIGWKGALATAPGGHRGRYYLGV